MSQYMDFVYEITDKSNGQNTFAISQHHWAQSHKDYNSLKMQIN